MSIELGSAPLTTRQFFEAIYLRRRVSLDSSVQQRVCACELPQITCGNRSESLLALQFLVNQGFTATQLNPCLQEVNGEDFNKQSSHTTTMPLYIASSIGAFSQAQAVLPLIMLNDAMFFELTCAPSQLVFADYQKFCATQLKNVCDDIKYLTLNTKKLNPKKPSPVVEELLVAVAELKSLQVNRLSLNELLQSSTCYLEHQQLKMPQIDLQTHINQCIYRTQLIQTKFTHTKGIWRGIELLPAELQSVAVPENGARLHDLLLAETSLYLKIISECSLAAKLQIGQPIMVALQELIKAQDDVTNITQLITSMLSTQSSAKRVPQPPAGTRDFTPAVMFTRQQMIAKITEIFKRHGAVSIETPVFETRSVLMEKYGDDQKLIFELQDFGEEPLALRYDLTVPFARYCVTHSLKNIKRYQIGRVYRRDKPNIQQGRFREFYQLDFDIGGDEGAVNDAEVLCVISEIMDLFKVDYKISINHRGILNQMIKVVGIPPEKFKAVCSVIDQLDKISPQEVIDKLVNQKGVQRQQAEALMKFVEMGSNAESFAAFVEENSKNELVTAASAEIKELQQVIQFMRTMNSNAAKNTAVDFALARGLEYYTGMVFEVKLTSSMSSVSGGGRYDNLLESINPTAHMPTVGGSIGIDRLFALLQESEQTQERELDAMICSAPGGAMAEKTRLYGLLVANGVRTGANFREGGSLKSLKRDLEDANAAGCKLAVMIGEEESKGLMCTIKDLVSGEQTEVPSDKFVDHCLEVLGKYERRFAQYRIEKIIKAVKSGQMPLEALDEVEKLMK